jgi:hypothetical protein
MTVGPPGWGPSSLPANAASWLAGPMFVHQEARLEVSLDVARARLSNLIRGRRLIRASEDAYRESITGLMRVGPVGGAPGLSRLVLVRFRELVTDGDSVVLALRWEADGPGGGLFPALDADITLTAAGMRATVLTLDGAYRPPLGAVGAGLDRAILHRAAAGTIQSFVQRVADAIINPASPAPAEQGAWEWERPRSAPESGDL